METKLIEKEGKTFTQFKVPLKQLILYKSLLKKYVDINNPIKKSTRFIYFECEGDLLNGPNGL